ncbi:hypothetical protein KC19_9G038200 [Ceratodon purpureus]|uniref:Heterokaryon incompatibility domain-containing protein n=1 Tax=Ceratodon purpureus TaxID=3225 RepID=A0A8T0GW14_CERPU|nr:hypothetical protein KC19_9G038200 [Ceratodon purpureus]
MSLYDKSLDSNRQEIRLLSIVPGQEAEDIQCTLSVISLHDDPKYTALFYVWGDSNTRKQISVNRTSFDVTLNLESALRHIRMSDVQQTVWVDAVCINQNDVSERNQQVALMGDLYTQAAEVIIWLGIGNKYLDMLAEVISETGLPTPPSELPADNARLQEYAVELCKINVLFKIISQLPWWTRIWTVQECLLSVTDPIFQCGSKRFSWTAFFRIYWDLYQRLRRMKVLQFESHPDYQELLKAVGGDADAVVDFDSFLPLDSIGVLRRNLGSGTRLPLSECVAACLGRKATLAHDYIYGILGLVSMELRQEITTDYNMSYRDLYQDFVELILFDGTSDDFQFFTWITFDLSPDGQPSWIPDLSHQRSSRYSALFLASPQPWRSVGEVWISDDNELLLHRGVYLDVLDSVHPITIERNEWRASLSKLEKISKMPRNEAGQLEQNPPFPPQELINASRAFHCRHLFQAALQATLKDEVQINDTLSNYWWDVMMDENHEHFNMIRSIEGSLLRPELNGMSISTVIGRMLAYTHVACKGRSLVKSRGGLRGISVPHAEPGDVIVGLLGWHMLVILRPGKDFYTIVGGVYVGGLMDWNVLDRCYERGELTEATFRIR